MKNKATIGIFLPTYKRPKVLQAVARNIEETTKNPFHLYFGLEPEDEAGIDAAMKTGHSVVINKYGSEAGYVNTIQTIYEQADEPFFIHANDDFEFRQDWDEVPLSMFKTPTVMVVGMRQNEEDSQGSAISMVRRKYIEERSGVVDMPNQVFYPYPHHYCDTEFTETAQRRGVWAFCSDWGINHANPAFTGNPKDETYKKNDATSEEGSKIFLSRRHLW
jgi:hypothetical protein